MNIRFNWLFKLASLSMASGLALGARFGHEGQLDEDSAKLFGKAQYYNISNSLGLVASSLVTSPRLPFKIAAAGFVLSQVLFTGPLYASAIWGKNPMLSTFMPVGGVSMIAGWTSLIFA